MKKILDGDKNEFKFDIKELAEGEIEVHNEISTKNFSKIKNNNLK